jgi:tRNA-binding protein
MDSATWADFEKLDIRVGRVVEVHPFPEGKHSTHVLLIDLGPALGTKKSVARLTPHYDQDDLLERLVLCVVNFPPRQIGKHQSEVLTLGVPDENGNTVLVVPERPVPLSGKLY